MDYAILTKDSSYCSKAGTYLIECEEKLGIRKNIKSLTTECKEITDYQAKAACLTIAAVETNMSKPCWDADYDRQRFDCIGKVAAKRKNIRECDRIIDSIGGGTRLQKAYCVFGYVKQTNDTTACKEIDRRKDIVIGPLAEECTKIG